MMEMEAGVCNFDVLTTGKPPLGVYLDKKWVTQYFSPSLKNIEERTIKEVFHNPNGYWTPTLTDLQLISYNSKSTKEADAPKNWTDLLDPKYKDKMAHADPRYSGTAMLTVAALSQFYGWDYYEKLAKNNPMITRGHGALVEIMIAGERPVAAEMLLLTVAKPIQSGEPIKVVFPTDGTVPTPWQSFLSSSMKHPNAAKLFIEYFLSAKVQAYCAENFLLYPVIRGLSGPKGFPRLDEIKFMAVDIQRAEKEGEEIKNTFWKMIEQ
jgi:iron(III) transport system substrate-binding protein